MPNSLVIKDLSDTFNYTFWLRASLDRCGVSYVVEKETSEGNFAIVETGTKRVALDWDDCVFCISERIAECDVYLKANQSTEIAEGKDLPSHPPGNFIRFRELYELHRERIVPWVLGRSNTFGFTELPEPREKAVLLATYSAGCGSNEQFGRNRENLYALLKRHLGDAFLCIYPGQNGEPLVPLMSDYGNYLDAMSRSLFALNLVGWCGSNPFRCIDASLAGSAVISDYIYVDAYKEFPRVELPGSCYSGEFDEAGVAKVLAELLAKPQKTFLALWERQKAWFERHLDLRVNCQQLTRWL